MTDHSGIDAMAAAGARLVEEQNKRLRSALAEALMQTAPSADGRVSHALQLRDAHERIAELCAELGVTVDDFGAR